MWMARLATGSASFGKAVGMTRLSALLLVTLLTSAGIASAQDTVIYYHTDAIGSVRMITDANGGVVTRYDYLSFGGDCAPNPPCTAQSPDTHQFAGKERDTDTGLDYFGARYYDSISGRFTTVDPLLNIQTAIRDPQQWNRYAYVLNNPVRYTDPDGRCVEDLCAVEFAMGLLAIKATQDVAGYLQSPQGQEQLRVMVSSLGQMVTTATEGVRSWFQTETRPGRLGKPDHRATVEEEAARIAGRPERFIPTLGGKKDVRIADAVGTNPETGAPEIVQVYRPTPAGNVPKREKDAAADIERATGVKPTMVPVRPLPAPKKSPEEEVH